VRRQKQADVTGPRPDSARESAVTADLPLVTPPPSVLSPAAFVSVAASVTFALLTVWVARQGPAVPAVELTKINEAERHRCFAPAPLPALVARRSAGVGDGMPGRYPRQGLRAATKDQKSGAERAGVTAFPAADSLRVMQNLGYH
jgi:hypothetical protein